MLAKSQFKIVSSAQSALKSVKVIWQHEDCCIIRIEYSLAISIVFSNVQTLNTTLSWQQNLPRSY